MYPLVSRIEETLVKYYTTEELTTWSSLKDSDKLVYRNRAIAQFEGFLFKGWTVGYQQSTPFPRYIGDREIGFHNTPVLSDIVALLTYHIVQTRKIKAKREVILATGVAKEKIDSVEVAYSTHTIKLYKDIGSNPLLFDKLSLVAKYFD